MKNHRILSGALAGALVCAGLAPAAEFSYVEKSEITGGAIKRMMGIVGRFAKGAMAPVTTTHSYSGGKMATVNEKSREIWDAGAETITHIDVNDKTYAVITFAEFTQFAKAMAEKMSEAFNTNKQDLGNARWKASFEKNGQTRQVAGVTANGGTMKLEMEGTDQKSGQTGVMKMDMDMFMGKVPGWEVKQAFDKQLSAKLVSQPGPQMQAMAQAGPAAMEAMKEAGKKMAELGEMQLAGVVRMYGEGMGGLPPETSSSSGKQSGASGSASSGGGESVGQVVKEEATREAEYEAARRIGGRIGGLGGRLGGRLGGLGRKPKEQPQQPATAPAPAPEAASAKPEPAAPAGPGVLLEFTTEVISYSATADASAFTVPAGFKQVEHPMKKAWSKYADKK